MNLGITGIRRRFDDLGRVVIPKEMRKSLNIEAGDLVDISCVNSEIILKPINTLTNNRIDKIKHIIKDMFDDNVSVYITDSYKVMYSPFEEEIGTSNKNVIGTIPVKELKYFENIVDETNTAIGTIYLRSKEKIKDEEIKFCKLLACILGN